MTPPDPEELLILIRERSFTTEELLAVSGVEPMTFRNWLKRGVIEVGEKHRVGRWLFSPVDMIRVSAMVDLAENIKLPPTPSNRLCDDVIRFLDLYIEKTTKKRADPHSDCYSILHAPLSNYVLVANIRGDEVKTRPAFWYEGELIFDPDDDENNERLSALRRITHITVAAGLVIDDVLTKVLAMREQEGGA